MILGCTNQITFYVSSLILLDIDLKIEEALHARKEKHYELVSIVTQNQLNFEKHVTDVNDFIKNSKATPGVLVLPRSSPQQASAALPSQSSSLSSSISSSSAASSSNLSSAKPKNNSRSVSFMFSSSSSFSSSSVSGSMSQNSSSSSSSSSRGSMVETAEEYFQGMKRPPAPTMTSVKRS